MDQKKVYNKFKGKTGSSNGDILNAEESRTFWSERWLSDLEEEMMKLEQQNLMINEGKVKEQCSKMPNWKAPGHDGVQGFWIKKLDKMHESIVTQLNEVLERMKEVFNDVRKNSAMSTRSSKGKRCGKLQTNNLCFAHAEITYRYYFRGYVLFHGKQKLTAR